MRDDPVPVRVEFSPGPSSTVRFHSRELFQDSAIQVFSWFPVRTKSLGRNDSQVSLDNWPNPKINTVYMKNTVSAVVSSSSIVHKIFI